MTFFFQAEDGIRDLTVTGVQTCALPIFYATGEVQARQRLAASGISSRHSLHSLVLGGGGTVVRAESSFFTTRKSNRAKIGRASCRERVEMSVVEGKLQEVVMIVDERRAA